MIAVRSSGTTMAWPGKYHQIVDVEVEYCRLHRWMFLTLDFGREIGSLILDQGHS